MFNNLGVNWAVSGAFRLFSEDEMVLPDKSADCSIAVHIIGLHSSAARHYTLPLHQVRQDTPPKEQASRCVEPDPQSIA